MGKGGFLTLFQPEIYIFDVVEITHVSTEKASDLMYKIRDDIDSQLTLITCGGKWNQEEKTYDDRIIVVCKKI